MKDQNGYNIPSKNQRRGEKMRGLVLEGGGTKGSYHAGVYKAILEEKIEIDGVTGTSIGALNGAMIVQDDFNLCLDIWKDMSYSMVIKANEDEIKRLMDFKLDISDLKFFGEKFKKIVKGGGLDITPLKKHIDEYIDEDKVRRSKKDFGIVTFNLTDMKPMEVFIEDIPKGELKDYLLASSYLPIFKTEKLGGKTYLDGGFFDNLPFGMLEKKGYRDFILVRTNASGIVRKINKDKINPTIISPSGDLGNMLTFDHHTAHNNIKMGYYDGLKVFRGLLGKSYYIRPKRDEDLFFNILYNLDEDKIGKIGELMRLPELPSKRVLFEYIVPKLGSLLGLSDDFTYEEFLISLLEIRAEKSGIDRFKIYTFEELKSSISFNNSFMETRDLTEDDKHSSVFHILKEITDVPMIFNREETIIKISDILFSEE